jgi:putative methionine-R-sulfoxide reductase with GAF domain
MAAMQKIVRMGYFSCMEYGYAKYVVPFGKDEHIIGLLDIDLIDEAFDPGA